MNQYEVPHEVSEALRRRREQIFFATVVTQTGQQLSSGQAILEGDPVRGTFWPDNAQEPDISPSVAAIMHRSDGTRIAINTFQRCPTPSSTIHYHFQT
jgi:hypothetical protein